MRATSALTGAEDLEESSLDLETLARGVVAAIPELNATMVPDVVEVAELPPPCSSVSPSLVRGGVALD